MNIDNIIRERQRLSVEKRPCDILKRRTRKITTFFACILITTTNYTLRNAFIWRTRVRVREAFGKETPGVRFVLEKRNINTFVA